jgi:hypothetical protein
MQRGPYTNRGIAHTKPVEQGEGCARTDPPSMDRLDNGGCERIGANVCGWSANLENVRRVQRWSCVCGFGTRQMPKTPHSSHHPHSFSSIRTSPLHCAMGHCPRMCGNRFGVHNTPIGVRILFHRPPGRTNRRCAERCPGRRTEVCCQTSKSRIRESQCRAGQSPGPPAKVAKSPESAIWSNAALCSLRARPREVASQTCGGTPSTSGGGWRVGAGRHGRGTIGEWCRSWR